MRWVRRLRYALRIRANADELREELETHRALLQANLERRGLDPEDAHATAARTMGNMTYMREEARHVWLPATLESIIQDCRFAWRGLTRSPAFTIVAVLSLAIGIGANTAIFSVIHSLLLAQLPVHDPGRLVELRRQFGERGYDGAFSRAELRTLSIGPVPLASFASTSLSVSTSSGDVDANIDAVDGRYFVITGTGVQRGRLLAPSDDALDARAIVITERFWRTQLNSDPAVLGQTIRIAGQLFAIVGVTSSEFAGLRFPARVDLFVPYAAAVSVGVIRDPDGRTLASTVVARLRDGQTERTVQRDLMALWTRCCSNGQLAAPVKGRAAAKGDLAIREISRGIPEPKLDLRAQYSRVLLSLMGGVAVLLLATCANVANLVLARGTSRIGELAVRVALGASRGRIVRQLAIESAQVSLLGTAFGVILARWGLGIFSARVGGLSAVIAPTLAPRILFLSASIGIACSLAFGILPALRLVRRDLISPLKQGSRRASMGRRGWVDRGLVAFQMAMALVLVSGATLFVETLRNLQGAQLGFEARARIAITVETRRTSYERQGITTSLAEQILRRARAIPGVESAAFASFVPIYGGRSSSDLVTSGADMHPDISFSAVSAGYFTTMGIPMLAGHDLNPAFSEPRTTARDVIVNHGFARSIFGADDPVGRIFQDVFDGDTLKRTNRVVGVVGDVKYMDARTPAPPAYYVPVVDGAWPFLVLVVRPSIDASAVTPAIRRAIEQLAPGIRQGDPESLSASIEQTMSRERFSAELALCFGMMALVLAAVGLYGVMLYQVMQRRAEIGIRMALGARAREVLQLVLRDAFVLTAVGIAIGLPLSLLTGKAVSSQLFDTAPASASVLAIASGLLAFVTIGASWVPARQALSVDSITALRAE